VEAAWAVIDPVLGDSGASIAVQPYSRGSWGPDSSSLLPPGESWYDPVG